jgi:Zn-dependent metalloprotease
MERNGLHSFNFHVDSDPANAAAELSGPVDHAGLATIGGMEALDAETVARSYLKQGLESTALPQFAVDPAVKNDVDFKLIGTETVPLTKSSAVKFRQRLNKIPVYGSLVTIELDRGNHLVSINSALGTPANVDPVARVSPATIAETVRLDAGIDQLPAESLPRLFFYFDSALQQWRLAYIAENVPVSSKKHVGRDGGKADGAPGAATQQALLPELYDYVVDAHSAEIVSKLPRAPTAQSQVVTARDSMGIPREVRVALLDGETFRLEDLQFNVHTYDAKFQDVSLANVLPGEYCCNTPLWEPDAVSAHANGAEVARFVREVLLRNGLDNQGEGFKASIHCLWGESLSQEWRNAAWYRNQMIYGQRQQNGRLVSYAVALDIVAHEFFHGVTDRTARLEYAGETGALNESYSDIFGMIVSNFLKPSLDDWNWEMGEDISGIPLRDFSDPPRRGQPDHMRDYARVAPPFHQYNDFGQVHVNSGIHNKAAFNMLTARQDAQYLFSPGTVAQIFYLALLLLSSNSTFANSRMAVSSAARSLLREDEKRDAKIAAIASAFDSVGITA